VLKQVGTRAVAVVEEVLVSAGTALGHQLLLLADVESGLGQFAFLTEQIFLNEPNELKD